MAGRRHGWAALLIGCLLAVPAHAQRPGWHYSPLPGEGDRAAMGCDREATQDSHTCLVVRCEDDFTTGVHVHSTRTNGDAGIWVMTVDRENAAPLASPAPGPYGARFSDDEIFLLERLRHGGFVILRHQDDPPEAPDRFIDLGGSFAAIATALAYCAPRVPEPGSDPATGADEASPANADPA